MRGGITSGPGWECAEWDGKHWIIVGSMHSYDDSDFVGIGDRIPAPDEGWQCVPEKWSEQMATDMRYAIGQDEALALWANWPSVLAAAPKPGGE